MNECDNRTNLQLKYNTWWMSKHKNIAQKHIAQKHIAQKLIAQNTWEKNN